MADDGPEEMTFFCYKYPFNSNVIVPTQKDMLRMYQHKRISNKKHNRKKQLERDCQEMNRRVKGTGMDLESIFSSKNKCWHASLRGPTRRWNRGLRT